MLQDVKVFSEDGTSKVVEILTDMTARDLCQLLVYRSHCVDDNSWSLVEHHPHLGLGRDQHLRLGRVQSVEDHHCPPPDALVQRTGQAPALYCSALSFS